MEELKQWINDTFYMDTTETKTYEGYYTERVSQGNYSYSTFELPFDVTVTTTGKTVDLQACAAFIIVVLTFVTVVTFLRRGLRL